jgi:hypothetical protein
VAGATALQAQSPEVLLVLPEGGLAQGHSLVLPVHWQAMGARGTRASGLQCDLRYPARSVALEVLAPTNAPAVVADGADLNPPQPGRFRLLVYRKDGQPLPPCSRLSE